MNGTCKVCGKKETIRANPDYCKECWSWHILGRMSIVANCKTVKGVNHE